MSCEEQKWRRMNKTRDFICNFGDKERVRETRLSVQINSLSLSLSQATQAGIYWFTNKILQPSLQMSGRCETGLMEPGLCEPGLFEQGDKY